MDPSLITHLVEFETHEQYTFGLPYSESYTELEYPVEVATAVNPEVIEAADSQGSRLFCIEISKSAMK